MARESDPKTNKSEAGRLGSKNRQKQRRGEKSEGEGEEQKPTKAGVPGEWRGRAIQKPTKARLRTSLVEADQKRGSAPPNETHPPTALPCRPRLCFWPATKGNRPSSRPGAPASQAPPPCHEPVRPPLPARWLRTSLAGASGQACRRRNTSLRFAPCGTAHRCRGRSLAGRASAASGRQAA